MYGRTVTKRCGPGDMIRLVAYYSVRVEHVERSIEPIENSTTDERVDGVV